jgi:hypothetical protein
VGAKRQKLSHFGRMFSFSTFPPNTFTREYTQCTAGYTFGFVVVVVVGGVVVGATFSQTWQYFSQQLMKHDQK